MILKKINIKYMTTYNYKNKNVVITGGAKGIGLETAIQFVKYGANVSILSKTYYKELESKFKLYKDRFNFYEVDVTDPISVRQSISEILNTQNRIDVLVNNASIAVEGTIDKINESDWDKVMSTNVKSYFLCTKEVINGMIKRKYGKIINVSSIAGRDKSILLGAAYSTSKAAVIGFTRHVATEVGKFGINVNCICPSQTYTPMLKEIFKKNQGLEKIVKNRNPLGYIAEPNQISSVILFLASDESNYMNGSIIDINGGVL
jgi:NAD(P)-dependent dehydrogenase (short-subunit alcohol dehydrogenase family)